MTKWNRFILPIALLAISLFIFVKTDALLWVAFLMFSVLSVAVNFFRFGRRLAEGSLADERRNEPLGVVCAITPWNSPLLLAAWKLAPAGR